MKDYYHILKIKRTATETEIKKAFRRLAIKYHPDKNLGSNTIELFQEINEAYETLGDTNLKQTYDQRYDYFFGGFSQKTYKSAPYNPPKYKTRSYERARPHYTPKKIDYSPYVPFFRKVNIAGLVLCLLLIADFTFTQKFENQEVIEMEDLDLGREMYLRHNSKSAGSDEKHANINTQDFDLAVEIEKSGYVEVGDQLDVYFTPIFRIARWVEFKNKPLAFAPHYGIYNSFLFIPAILLIVSFMGVFIKKGEKFIIDSGIVALIFIILTIIFILVS